MNSMKHLFAAVLFSAAVILPAGAADVVKPPEQEWSFEGPFGTFDRSSLQRGFQLYKETCAVCHGMRLVHYRNLQALGYSEDEIKAIAASVEVQDGPNDQGEMFMRPGRPSDRFRSPFPNDQAARVANNGALPPDLSVIAKARPYGPDYLYALLTGYTEPPQGFQMMEGMSYNSAFPGHQIAMAPPLSEGAVTFADGTKATVAQMARDVTVFLTWAAHPEMEERKRLGFKVMLFLLVLTGVLYAAKRRIWRDVH